ncbi:MAG: hypothetical protein ABI885_25130 [Gammaproteobacteria bacterium]
MNSQNRMNAGAEYVLYRIWATLQDQNGIHAESLITCVGALAGYACQACVRQTAALPGADPGKYALRTLDARDGIPYVEGEALKLPLSESPLSVWALISRAVQKLGEPLPDIDGIFRHVTETLGTGAFGIPRVSDGNGPRHPAIVYLKQIWPQILPIAQRFCRKPAQIPVLFGIALQRAIEQTQGVLSPTLSASIAMECAVAMSKVFLPELHASLEVTVSTATTAEIKALPMPMPMALPMRGTGMPARKRKGAVGAEPSAPGLLAFVARLPKTARFVAMGSLATIAIAGVMYKSDPTEPVEAAREVRTLVTQQSQEGLRVVERSAEDAPPAEEASPPPEEPPPQEALASQEQQFPAEEALAPATSEAAVDDWMNSESQLQSRSDGNSEMMMGDPAERLN